ncbi:MAG TPA: DUF3187 family protein [Gemmatimonadales bacterium]|nr:DUF3187 family protein [Gemmatimonadales bacterium]
MRTSRSFRFAALASLGWLTAPLAAQGLPPYTSMNPMVSSRTGLATQPYVNRGRPWRVTAQIDYASLIEYDAPPQSTAAYLLDAELFRAEVTVTRELGKRSFLLGQTSLNAAYDGFLDGFLDWYHDLFGFPTGARKIRPRNRFGDSLSIAGGPHFLRDKPGASLGDLRLGAGFRHSEHWQTVLSATLPTNTAPDGFKRGTFSVNAVTTLRSDFGGRFTYEGTLGGGVTPSHGDLEAFQHTTFLMVSQGLRARLAGPVHLYTNLIYHSALYHDTGTSELDARELTLDLGGMFKFRRGPEWILGLTEDLEPSGPAIDVSFRLGARW